MLLVFFYWISELLDLFEKKLTESCGYSVFQEMLMNQDLWRFL